MKIFNRADVQCAPEGSLFIQVKDYFEAINVLRDLARQEDWEGEDVTPASPIGRAWRLLEKEKTEDKQLWEK